MGDSCAPVITGFFYGSRKEFPHLRYDDALLLGISHERLVDCFVRPTT